MRSTTWDIRLIDKLSGGVGISAGYAHFELRDAENRKTRQMALYGVGAGANLIPFSYTENLAGKWKRIVTASPISFEDLDNKAAILRVASISKGGESQRASAIWLVIQDGYIPMPFVSRKLMSAFIFSSGSALKPDESWSTPGAGAGGLLGIVRVDLDTEVLDPPDIPDPPIPVNPIPVIPHVIPSPKPPPRRVSVEADVLFGFDSSRIKPEAAARLFDVLAEIERRGRPDVLIEGHTDSVGSDEYNEGLSVRRAEAVRQWFREHLAPGAASFRVEGKGEEENIASNSTAAGRARNRRVEIVIS